MMLEIKGLTKYTFQVMQIASKVNCKLFTTCLPSSFPFMVFVYSLHKQFPVPSTVFFFFSEFLLQLLAVVTKLVVGNVYFTGGILHAKPFKNDTYCKNENDIFMNPYNVTFSNKTYT